MVFLASCVKEDRTDFQKGMDQFVSELMDRMTIDEKIGQLNLPVSGEIVTGQAKSSDIAKLIEKGQVGGLFNLKGVDRIRDVQQIAVEKSRLGIPLIFGMDVIHGYETIFPIPLAMSCTWDPSAAERSARIAAKEASADGIAWTFSPMSDLSRDPRWGRIAEGSGEDPYLSARMTAAMVRGYQGERCEDRFRSPDEIMACIKHFALYGAVEAGRDYNTVDMSQVRMFNEYFPPYKAAIDMGVFSVMASFNEINGIPATANRWLLTDVLRDRWGYDGFVVTDFTAIAEMNQHGIGDLKECSVRAINAGTDMDMVSDGYVKYLKDAVDEGLVHVSTIDRACRRILEAKYKLGLFEDPYRYCDLSRPSEDIFTPENRAEARRIASESFVLLKNGTVDGTSGKVLPLKKSGKIALIGPLGNSRENMAGTWSVAARLGEYPSLYEGLTEMADGRYTVRYAKGSNLVSDSSYEERATMFGRSLNRDERSDEELLQEALHVARSSDVIVAALGESSEMSGESSCRTELGIPDVQRHLLEQLLKTGKPVVLVLFTGRPLTLEWENENVPAILNVWFGGSEAAYAIGDVLFGDVNPSGKLTMTFPKNVGQIPLYYNHKNTGRPLEDGKWFSKFTSNYLDVDNEPLYPFGYGLSYTHFTYSDLKLDKTEAGRDDTVHVSVKVTNDGAYDGSEVVQLYVRDMVGSITRPVSELKGFQRVGLKSRESSVVTFELKASDLTFFNENLEEVYEPGVFKVMLGTNSRDVLAAELTIK